MSIVGESLRTNNFINEELELEMKSRRMTKIRNILQGPWIYLPNCMEINPIIIEMLRNKCEPHGGAKGILRGLKAVLPNFK